MKNFKLVNLTFIAAAALVLSSCGGINKMKDSAKNINYTVTPSPLVMKSGKVDFTVESRFPTKYFNKKATLTVTPVLKYDGNEQKLEGKSFQGEGVEANNEVINYAEGGTKKMAGSTEYTEGMRKSELFVNLSAEFKGKTVEFGEYKIADGVIATAALVQIDPKPIMIPDKYQRIIPESYEANILYAIQTSDIRNSELKKDEVKELNSYITAASKNDRKELKGVKISAYASPDGPIELNEKLAEGRKNSAQGYMEKEIKKAKLQVDKDNFFSLLTTAEDWEGFKVLVQESTIKDKELILRVLQMYSDPQVREREIKNLSATYDELAKEILPKLRRSKLIANVDLVGHSDEEIATLFQNNKDSLVLEELLYGASLSDDLDTKAAYYQAAANKYPDCFRAKNNLGFVYIYKGDLANAKSSFEASQAIKDNEVAKNNLGVIALMEGDVNRAEELFTASMAAGKEASYNLGIVNIIKGNYEAAVNYFGNECTFNTALAKLLNGQTDAAVASINCIENPDAMDYYLKAIVGARNANDDLFFSNLRNAVGKDSSLKGFAQNDLEFYKYFSNDTFKQIVQ